jgi:hypothetical protein
MFMNIHVHVTNVQASTHTPTNSRAAGYLPSFVVERISWTLGACLFRNSAFDGTVGSSRALCCHVAPVDTVGAG